ncbi:hypothetical protein CRG98_043411 [Punica granatum]|nr:hypothetical protein CRG98_043411 [Punica granatum]
MEKTCYLSGANAAGGLAALSPEFLMESDDDEEMAELPPEAFGIKEELVQKVMQELYKEITREPTSSSSVKEHPHPQPFVSGEVKDRLCEMSETETAAKAMAGVHFIASGQGGKGRLVEEHVGLPAVGGGLPEYGPSGFKGVQKPMEIKDSETRRRAVMK